MGGRSNSRQTTTNAQETTNLVNDGEFAGASNISIDESDRSVNDSNNSEYNLEQNIDRSVRDSNNSEYNLDQSVRDSNNQDYNLDQQIDNSTRTEQDIDNSMTVDQEYEYSGANSGNSGTINMLDGGAIKANEEISKAAIDAAREQAKVNERIVAESLNQSISFGKEALGVVGSTSTRAIQEVGDNARDAVGMVSEFGGQAIDLVSGNLTQQAEKFASGLADISTNSSNLNSKILAQVAQASTEDKETIAGIARSTSLAGQDLVASASQKMVLYVAVALGLVGVSFAAFSGGR